MTEPIEKLKPESEEHKKVLNYLLDRIKMSEDKMSAFYPRWSLAESKLQAYIKLGKHEETLRDMNDKGAPPAVVSIVVPYTYATLATIVTYHLHTFCGRRPIFQVSTNKKETAVGAQNMELFLQYNADHTKMAQKLWQFFWDCQSYGLGVIRSTWNNKWAKRTVWTERPGGLFGIGAKKVKERQKRLVYAGNVSDNVDPYLFFPDPRVPMYEVNRRGEFVFWRHFCGKHTALELQAEGHYMWVSAAGRLPNDERWGSSNRALVSMGDPQPGSLRDSTMTVQNFVQVDEGSVVIVPSALGLGESNRPERWLFTILNKRQIVRALPLDLDHDMHPIVVSEPYSFGYSFGSVGLVDYIGPLQDTLSWFINSHIYNVRTVLNNMLVYDPSRINGGDLDTPQPGRKIRVKSAGYGQNVQEMIQQLNVVDVTQQHTRDFELFMRLADSLSGVSDNIRGIQDAGGRKTATEVRTSSESGASRLAAQAMVMSSQAIVDLTTQWAINAQQFMEEEIYLNVVGRDGALDPVLISPEHLVGDYHYPVNDGTLPIDRVAMLDVWKEIFLAVEQNPNLSQRYNGPAIFEYVARLGGAKDLSRFRLDTVPDEQLAAAASAGNVVPLGGMSGTSGGTTQLTSGTGQTPGLPGRPPANRMGGQL